MAYSIEINRLTTTGFEVDVVINGVRHENVATARNTREAEAKALVYLKTQGLG